MYEQAFDSLKKATESSVKLQQEMLQKWVEAFPGASSAIPTPANEMAKWRHQLEEMAAEMLKKQKELVDQNYDAGIKALEDIFAVTESTSPQEYQQKVTQLYQKSFESIRELSEAQMNEFKSVAEKWTELMTLSKV